MKKIVLGDGYIGSAYKDAGYHCIASNEVRYDGSNFNQLTEKLEEYDVIVNCIAKTDTKWTENPDNFSETWQTNVELVQKLSEYCGRTDKKFVHISTGDLYGNSFEWEKNVETNFNLNSETNYRLTKLVAERLCSPNDLILRIRLPFDARNHPKNLVIKSRRYTKFYQWANVYTYVPDLIKATNILLENDKTGIFNVVQTQSTGLLHLNKIHPANNPNVLSIDMHDAEDVNVIRDLDKVHIHNDINSSKLTEYVELTDLHKAWELCSILLDNIR
jgi:nucleoside-diphosphate-sugar epimerase